MREWAAVFAGLPANLQAAARNHVAARLLQWEIIHGKRKARRLAEEALAELPEPNALMDAEKVAPLCALAARLIEEETAHA